MINHQQLVWKHFRCFCIYFYRSNYNCKVLQCKVHNIISRQENDNSPLFVKFEIVMLSLNMRSVRSFENFRWKSKNEGNALKNIVEAMNKMGRAMKVLKKQS